MPNYASAEKDHSVGQEQQALAMQKFGMIQGQHDTKLETMQADQQRKDLELWLNQQRKMLEVQLQHALNVNSQNHEHSLKMIQ